MKSCSFYELGFARVCKISALTAFLDAIVRQNGQFGAKIQSAKNIYTKYDP